MQSARSKRTRTYSSSNMRMAYTSTLRFCEELPLVITRIDETQRFIKFKFLMRFLISRRCPEIDRSEERFYLKDTRIRPSRYGTHAKPVKPWLSLCDAWATSG